MHKIESLFTSSELQLCAPELACTSEEMDLLTTVFGCRHDPGADQVRALEPVLRRLQLNDLAGLTHLIRQLLLQSFDRRVQERLRDVRVLVVDDEVELCELLADVLREQGADVECAYDGDGVWARHVHRPYDCVVSDIMMPKMNGLDLSRQFLREPGPRPRLSLITGGYRVARDEALRCGAMELIEKPVDMQILAAVVADSQRENLAGQRRWLELNRRLDVKLEAPVRLQSRDVAIGGAFIDEAEYTSDISTLSLPEGAYLTFRFTIDGGSQEIPVVGEVIGLRRGAREHLRGGLIVRFVRTDPSLREILQTGSCSDSIWPWPCGMR